MGHVLEGIRGVTLNPQQNGLAMWRAKQAEEKRLRLLELEHYRAYATTEVRDGREYRVVRIPDRYDFSQRSEPPVQLHGPKRKQYAA